MPIRLPALFLALLGTLFFCQTTRATEAETVTALAIRAQHRFAEDYRVDVQLSQRWYEGFKAGERSIFSMGLSHNIDRWQVSGGYNMHFNRSVPGKEQRLWQQLRYTFDTGRGELESSVRVEERYFTSNREGGGRLRILNSWNYPLGTRDELSLGYEWLFNMNDIGTAIRRGVAQHRLISGLEHTLANGHRMDLDYQLRIVHIPAAENRLQHQLQLTYVVSF